MKHAIIWSYSLVFFYLLLKPAGQTSETFLFEHSDKLIHFVGHFILANLYLWYRADKMKLVSILLLIMAILTEFLQHLIPGRSFDIWDIIANLLGVILGLWVAHSYICHTRR